MKQLSILIVVFVICASPAIADKYLDSLFREYHTARTDTLRFDLLYHIISECTEKGNINYNPAAITSLLDKTIQELRVKQEFRRLETFLRIKAKIHDDEKDYESALSYYDSCIQIAESLKEYNLVAHLFWQKKLIYQYLNYNDLLVQSIYGQIENYRKAGDIRGQGFALFDLGTAYQEAQQDELALKSFLQAADLYKSVHDSLNVGIAMVFAAMIVMKNGDLALAEKYLDIGKVVVHSRSAYQPFYYYFTHAKWLKAMRRTKEALLNFDLASVWAVKGNQIIQKANALCEMAEIYIDEKNFIEAKRVIDEAKTIAYEAGFIGTQSKVRKTYSRYYEATGDPGRALAEFKIWQALTDSLNEDELTRALTNFRNEAEFRKREMERAEEQRKKDDFTKLTLRRQKLIAHTMGIILVFTTIIAFLIYRNYQNQKKAHSLISSEKKRSDDLLHNILPVEVAQELKTTGSAQAKTFREVTVMFTDFKDFTVLSGRIPAQQIVDNINYYYSAFDDIIDRYGIEKIKTIGDSYMCAGGVPVENTSHSEDMVLAALEIMKFVHDEKKKRTESGETFFEIRIGMHTGPVIAGIVGTRKFAYDIWGDTVNVAARMEQNSDTGKINISGSTYHQVKDKFNCTYRGKIEAKNKGEVEMYFVEWMYRP